MNSEPTHTILRIHGGLSLRTRRTWFTDPPADDDAPPPPPKGKGSNPPPPPEKTFTQAELDAHLGNVRKEAKQAALNDLLKEMGAENLDTFKDRVKKLTDLEASQMSELEKAQKAAQKAIDDAAALKTQYEAEKAGRLIDRRNVAITAAAAKAHNPKDVLRWAEDDGKDLLAKVMNDEGVLDDGAVKSLVDACQKAMPHYFGTGTPGTPSFRDGRTTDLDKVARDANFKRARRGF